MPPVFGPVSPSPIRLKSCAGRHRDGALAVAQREQRQLLALEELLDQHARAGLAEAAVDEEVAQRRAGPRPGTGR